MANAFAENPFRQVPERRTASQEAREKAWVDYKVAENEFERTVLFAEPARQPLALERYAKDIRTQHPENAEPVLDFLVASAWHDQANAYNQVFHAWVEKRAHDQGKRVSELSSEEMKRLYAEFPDKARLETDENRALGLYTKSTQRYWKGERFDGRDALAQRIGLEARMAQHRLPAGEGRVRQIELLDAFRRVINEMSDSGAKSEFQVVYMIRKWILEKGLEHLISVELGLPREDFGDKKIDLRLFVEGVPYAFQLKTEVKDKYRAEHYERVREKASGAIQGTGTQLVTINTEALRMLYDKSGSAESKGDRANVTRAKHAVLDAFSALLPEEQSALISKLSDRKAEVPKAKERGTRLTRDFLIRAANIPTLIRLGVLTREETVSPTAVMKAKESVAMRLTDIAKVVGTQEGFQSMDDETANKIAAILKGE